MSVYDRDAFQERVNFAAARILSGGASTRHFDTCFEMNDGDFVVEALRRRALKNPKLAAGLPKYINASSIADRERLLGHLSRKPRTAFLLDVEAGYSLACKLEAARVRAEKVKARAESKRR